jgi:energy-coupling factor transporter ATP-binding protein EcfA2
MRCSYQAKWEAYQKIINEKTKYGIYHKAIFHIHTPASHDYYLFEQWKPKDYMHKPTKYKNASTSVLYNKLLVANGLPSDGKTLSNSKDEINYDTKIFCTAKEYISYMLIATTLIEEKVEIAVVMDHNTIDGIKKLRKAVDELIGIRKSEIYPTVIGGIEISCADRLHIAGIFDVDDVDTARKIDKWLNEHLLNQKEGSYETSLTVLKNLSEIGVIPYIAHLNSADLFKDEKTLNGAYKKKLYSSPYLKYVGVSSIEQIDNVKERINKKMKIQVGIILDNDSHCIEQLKENYFWVKGSKIGFSMIKEAIFDWEVSLSFKQSDSTTNFIKGMYIEPNNDSKDNHSFLTSVKENEGFIITFSKSLNCFIGGRGTGKSTILELLEYVFNQQCQDENMLGFICRHGNLWVLCEYKGREYLIFMKLPHIQHEDENILKYFSLCPFNDDYEHKYYFYKADVAEFALKQFLCVYRVTRCKKGIQFEEVSDKKKFLEQFYNVRYSVHELVNIASSEKMNDFIRSIVLKHNEDKMAIADINTSRTINDFLNVMNEIPKYLQKEKSRIEEILKPYNEKQVGLLKINYSLDNIVYPPLKKWIFGNDYDEGKNFLEFNITQKDVLGYFQDQCYTLSPLKFLYLIFTEEILNYNANSLYQLGYERKSKDVENGVMEITQFNQNEVFSNVCKRITDEINIGGIKEYISQYEKEIGQFNLEFNVNSNAANQQQTTQYENVRNLSLGQKVVAMLDFILGYSEFMHDYRPLLIDQPEDNLDSQYIYNNLVQQLRATKDQRQIIIATHNATIVTNSLAEQVCVLKSNGRHGWIEAVGYPSEKRIKKHILNYLEGGIDSFNHKIRIYQEALKSK